MPSKAVDLDLTPAEANLKLYAGVSDTLTVYRRERGTENVLSMTGYTNPVAEWRPGRGDATVVSLGAVLQADSVVVTISSAMKAAFSSARGVWQVDITDDNADLITLVSGGVELHQEVGT